MTKGIATSDIFFQAIRVPHRSTETEITYLLIPAVRDLGFVITPYGEYQFSTVEAPEQVAALDALVGTETHWDDVPDWIRDEYAAEDGTALLSENDILPFA